MDNTYLKKITGCASKVIKRPSNKNLKIKTNVSLTKLYDRNSNSDQNSISLTPLKPNESVKIDVEKFKRKVINLQAIKLKKIESDQFKTPTKIQMQNLPQFNYTVPKNNKSKKILNAMQEVEVRKFSTNSFNQLSESSQKTVSFEKTQIEYLKGKLAHCYFMLGEEMFKLLCPIDVISRIEFIEKCRDHLLFTYQESFCISMLCWSTIEINGSESPDSSMITFDSDIVENKPLTFGNIRSKIMDLLRNQLHINKSSCSLMLKKLCKENNDKTINDFLQSIDKLCSKESIEVIDVIESVTSALLKVNIKELLSILCRKSSSMKVIKSQVMKEELSDVLRKEMSLKKNKNIKCDNKNADLYADCMHLTVNNKKAKCHIKTTNTNETSNSERNIKRKDVIFRIADELYIRGITLLEAINSKVYDKVIDGCEYQLIRKRDLVACLKKIGLEFDDKDRKYLDDLLVPILNDSTDVKELITVIKGLGISEDIPSPMKNINFFQLDGRIIRIFNSIIKYMKEYDVSEVLNIIPKEEIDLFTVVSTNKERTVETIRASKFRDLLRSKEIINYGEELEEQFIELLQISEYHEDILLLQKLQKYINVIKNHKYFSYFGLKMRNIDTDTCNLAPVRKAVKRYSNIIYQTTSSEDPELTDSNKNMNKDMNPDTKKKIKQAIEMWKYRQLQNRRIKETVNKAKMAFLKMISNIKDNTDNDSNLVRLNDSKDEIKSGKILYDISVVSSLKESVTPNETFISIHNSMVEDSSDRIRQLRKKFGLFTN